MGGGFRHRALRNSSAWIDGTRYAIDGDGMLSPAPTGRALAVIAAHPDFRPVSTGEAPPAAPPAVTDAQLKGMRKAELEALAADLGADLGGCTNNQQRAKAIKAALAERST